MNILEVVVRPALTEDEEPLQRLLPRGHPQTHRIRIRQTEAGEGMYVIAWHGDRPIGHAFVRWQEPEPFRSNLPGTPTIQDVGVHQEFRSMGVGSRMLDFLEGLALERGYDRVGLGVGVDNKRAQLLYERRGYLDTGWPVNMESWTSMDGDGREYIDGELCLYMYKDLR